MTAYAYFKEIFPAEALMSLKKNLVAERVTSTQFSGPGIVYGQKIHIYSPGSVSVVNYTINTGFDGSVQVVDDTQTYLTIDQKKGYRFFVDHLVSTQGALDPTGPYAQEAAYAIRSTIDTAVLAEVANAASANRMFPSAVTTGSTITADLLRCHRLLDEQNVPAQGRYLCVSARVLEVIRACVAARATGWGDTVLENGFVGNFLGFDIYFAPNTAVVSGTNGTTHAGTGTKVVHRCLFGVPQGIELAYSVPPDLIRMFNPEGKMGTEVDGLCVYGIKTVDSGKRIGYFNAWWDS